MPSLSAVRRPAASSREEIATIRQWRLFCIAGITFSTPIRAVEITPHFTGSNSPSSFEARGSVRGGRQERPVDAVPEAAVAKEVACHQGGLAAQVAVAVAAV